MLLIPLFFVFVVVFIRMAIKNYHRLKQKEVERSSLVEKLQKGEISQSEYELRWQALD